MTVYIGDRAYTTAEHHAMLLAGLRAQGIDPCPACYTPLTDGTCKPCRTQRILDADPDWSAMADAQARLDDGRYDLAERPGLEATVARFWALAARAETDAATEVNACRHCRIDKHRHGQRWTPGAGWHAYGPPSDALRLRRLYARRAKRLGLPIWSRPGRPAPAKPAAARTCVVCGGPSPGVECPSCFLAADVQFKRGLDV